MELIPWEQGLNSSAGLSTNLTCAPYWLTFLVPGSAGPFAVLPLRGPYTGWNSPSSSPCCFLLWPPSLLFFPLCSLLPVTSSLPPPLSIMKHFRYATNLKNYTVNTHTPNHLDSTTNILLCLLSHIFLHLSISVHCSAHVVLCMHFIAGYRNKYTLPLNISTHLGIN